MSALFFRHAFSDYHSLRDVERGVLPEARDLRRRLFVLERRLDTRRPDHFYHAYLEERFADATSLGRVPRLVLSAMARRFLVAHPGGVFVRSDAMDDWQSAIGLLSPLAVATLSLLDDRGPGALVAIEDLVRDRLGTTACRGPLVPELEDLIATEGLFELHMHLNGSTEIDAIWEDVTRDPDAYRREFSAPFESRESIRELYDQIEHGLDNVTLFRRIKAARRARQLAARALRIAIEGPGAPELGVAAILSALALDAEDNPVELPGVFLSDPAVETLLGRRTDLGPLEREAAFLAACFDGMERFPDLAEAIGVMLWHNFTVFSQIARLAVHQFDQSGFHQFNKAVQSGVRERIERSYSARFRQLNGAAAGGDLAYVDGRFAPKDAPEKTAHLLETVIDGLLAYRGCPARSRGRNLHGVPPPCLSGPCTCNGRRDRLDLALVAHFIKLPDTARDSALDDRVAPGRHMRLRRDLARRHRALRTVMTRSSVARTMIRGVDGAGNELDAPPEVFAPTFRAMRRNGAVPGATYHVGEDFLHLASGIRAVREAVNFLDLTTGDRVGHAIALGVEPSFWIERMRDRVLVPREHILDDAVYALGALREMARPIGNEARLIGRIETLSRALYGEVFTCSDLDRAWRLRRLDLLEVLELEYSFGGDPDQNPEAFARHAHRTADDTLDDLRASEQRLVAEAASSDPFAFRLYRLRHDPEFIRRGRTMEEVVIGGRDQQPEYSVDALCALQEHGIGELNRARIAVEAMPTSNVRINAYRTYDEHHLLRWLGLAGTPLSCRPTVCLGSDDPGIFTTNARNEYAHVYLAMTRTLDPRTAVQHLRELNATGRSYRFRPTAP